MALGHQGLAEGRPSSPPTSASMVVTVVSERLPAWRCPSLTVRRSANNWGRGTTRSRAGFVVDGPTLSWLNCRYS
jgi:hypothetical protein